MIDVKDVIKIVSQMYEETESDFSDSVGNTFSVNPLLVFPRNFKGRSPEWENIDETYKISSDAITVSVNKYGELVVKDGHHRLHNAIVNKKKNIKVVVVDRINYYKM
jgi:hypothetical protein